MKGLVWIAVALGVLGATFALGLALGGAWARGGFWTGTVSGFAAGFGLMAAATLVNALVGRLDRAIGGPPPR